MYFLGTNTLKWDIHNYLHEVFEIGSNKLPHRRKQQGAGNEKFEVPDQFVLTGSSKMQNPTVTERCATMQACFHSETPTFLLI